MLLQVIYGKMKNEVKECESLILLGEVHLNLHTSLHDFHFMNYTSIIPSEQVSLENSNFKQAVEDLLTCLAKRLKALPADSRYLN